MHRVYLSGPMTGLPDFNYPAFNAEAARLRALGYEVVNPAENPEQSSWADYMRQDIPQLLTCDTIALLPDWHESRGAKLEHHIACQLGIHKVSVHQVTAPCRHATLLGFPVVIDSEVPPDTVRIKWNRFGDHPDVSVYNFQRSGASPSGLSMCMRCFGDMHMKLGDKVLHTHGFIEAGGQVVCPGDWIGRDESGRLVVASKTEGAA